MGAALKPAGYRNEYQRLAGDLRREGNEGLERKAMGAWQKDQQRWAEGRRQAIKKQRGAYLPRALEAVCALHMDAAIPETEPRPEAPDQECLMVAAMRFLACTTQVILVDEGDKTVEALVDCGACVSCAPLSLVKGSQARISREKAQNLCTANGQPLGSTQGELVVRLRFPGYAEVFKVPMQIIDTEVPLLLGVDFLAKHQVRLDFWRGSPQMTLEGRQETITCPLRTCNELQVAAMAAAVGLTAQAPAARQQ